MPAVKVYTRTGDDGTTGLFFGGRVAKDSPAPAAYGDVDELQSYIGVARASSKDDGLNDVLLHVAADLWVLMAELATAAENRHKLTDGSTKVTASMVAHLEEVIDEVSTLFDPPTAFVVPGANLVSAHLDVARTIARRAERTAIRAASDDSLVITYLNRVSDLLWTLARWQEDDRVLAKEVAARDGIDTGHETPDVSTSKP